jgi:hypothetical protein
LPSTSTATDALARPTVPCDAVYATAVVSGTGQAARFLWARSAHGAGKPLVLLDFAVEYLSAAFWEDLTASLAAARVARRARYGSAGVYVEGEPIAEQARLGGTPAVPVPDHLTTADYWPRLCASASASMQDGAVGYTAEASAGMDRRPFLDGFRGGPRDPDDPVVPAFLYGVVVGLDPSAAVPPRPARVTIVRGNRSR